MAGEVIVFSENNLTVSLRFDGKMSLVDSSFLSPFVFYPSIVRNTNLKFLKIFINRHKCPFSLLFKKKYQKDSCCCQIENEKKKSPSRARS